MFWYVLFNCPDCGKNLALTFPNESSIKSPFCEDCGMTMGIDRKVESLTEEEIIEAKEKDVLNFTITDADLKTLTYRKSCDECVAENRKCVTVRNEDICMRPLGFNVDDEIAYELTPCKFNPNQKIKFIQDRKVEI